ncbi:oligosaccharide flippase family protein, partial [Oenococcus oeni]|uniref:oligosaccharide flippase family protein n=1 Tax=Oenococcus oeni TaxID=1247 RepID=UPI00164914BC
MRIIKNYLYNAGYQVLLLLLPVITAPYVSRVLGPNGVGTYSYTFSILSYFNLFGTLGLTIYGNRQIAYFQNDMKQRSQIFWEVFFLRIITLLIAEVVFLFLVPFGQMHFYSDFQVQSLILLS